MSNDKASPSSVKKSVDAHKDDRHKRDLIRIREEGHREGLKKGHQDILEWLNAAYLDPKVSRNSPEGEAILKLAREAALHFNPEITQKRGRR